MLETIVCAVIGLCAAILLSVVFSLKTKGILRVIINAVAGVTALLVLQLFKVGGFVFNPLSALISGFLGVPGLLVIYIITNFL